MTQLREEEIMKRHYLGLLPVASAFILAVVRLLIGPSGAHDLWYSAAVLVLIILSILIVIFGVMWFFIEESR